MRWTVLSAALIGAALLTSPAQAKGANALAKVESVCADEVSAARRVCTCRYVGKSKRARRIAGAPSRPGTVRAYRR